MDLEAMNCCRLSTTEAFLFWAEETRLSMLCVAGLGWVTGGGLLNFNGCRRFVAAEGSVPPRLRSLSFAATDAGCFVTEAISLTLRLN